MERGLSNVRNALPQDSDVPASAAFASQANIYRLLRFVAAAVAAGVVLWLLSDIVVVVFASALLAVILHGSADLLHRKTRIPYWASLLAVVVLILAAFAGLVVYAGPGLADQVEQLRKALGGQVHSLHDRLAAYPWGNTALDQVPKFLGGNKENAPASMPSGVAGTVANAFSAIFGLFGTVVVIVIAALYLAATPSLYVDGMLRLVPVQRRHQASKLCRVAGKALWSWSVGQAVDMLFVGILSAAGLWLIGVPLALVLGVIAALFNFVPYIGAIVGSVPGIIIAFSLGTSTGLETLGLYLAIQAFEGNVMAPLIQKHAVDLPPGLTILSQTAFGSILGIPGLIFATPMTAALLAVLDEATPELAPEDRITAA